MKGEELKDDTEKAVTHTLGAFIGRDEAAFLTIAEPALLGRMQVVPYDFATGLIGFVAQRRWEDRIKDCGNQQAPAM